MSNTKVLCREAVRNMPSPESPPGGLLMIKEARTLLDISSIPISLAGSWVRRTKENKVDALPVIMFPGFASDQRYMKPLQTHLTNLGYQTEDWGLGVNMAGINLAHTLEQLSEGWDIEVYDGYSPETYSGEAGVPFLCDRATEQIRLRVRALGSPVALVGWSLGGYIAREVARELSEDVAHVITLGAPVLGGPKYTKAASIFRRKGFNLDWIESESAKRDSKPIQQPITAIFSKSDAIVNWPAAIDRVSPNIEHIELNVPHLGMGFNRSVWKIVERSLHQHATR